MEYREETGREMMARAREQLRIRNEKPSGAPPPAPFRMPAWPPVTPAPDPPSQSGGGSSGVHTLRVPCPFCKAVVGMPCFIPSHSHLKPHGGTHPSRRAAEGGVR